jgi:DNA topoisomerase-1
MEAEQKQVGAKAVHLPPTLDAAESSPTKKPRLDGAKPKSKKEKHKHKHKNKDHHHHHHHKHSGSEPKPVKPVGGSRPNGKVSSSVKKEPVTPVKRKPMISESDDDDDMIPPAVSRVQAPKEAPAVVAVAQMTPPTFRRPHPLPVKEEVDRSTADPKPKVLPMVKRESSADENGGPIAKKKSQPAPTVKAKEEPATASPSKPPSARKRKKSPSDSNGEDGDFTPKKSKVASKSKATPTPKAKAKATPTSEKKEAKSPRATGKKATPKSTEASPQKGGGRKKKEEPQEVWKWWLEDKHPEGVKWVTLEHKGPYFAPPYERLPRGVQLVYNGEPMELSETAEEAAGFFAKMLDHDYTKKDIFCDNFFADWRKEMTRGEASRITDFQKCDFTQIHEYYKERSEARKAMSKEEKKKLKEENDRIAEEYGWAVVDSHRQKIGNFKTEPPGLFRGRGDHPKQGRIKRRIEAEDVTINIGKGVPVPEPPEGHQWKVVQHDNKVTWLASWTENIQGAIKYVMLNPTSKIKGEKDWQKYETSRKLKTKVDDLRSQYMEDWKSKEMKVRQIGVAMYFIDKLALRAGNEKDSDETADTVGCCSLRVEHITLHEELDGKEFVVEFDFLGKDSIRYYNRVPVDKQAFKNLKLFVKDKQPSDDLFDRLTTTVLNKYLQEQMEGLTAKVFRTFNASITLQEQLEELTVDEESVPSKILSYNRANRAVAILCNHQRAPPKTFDQQLSNLQAKVSAKEETILEVKAEVKALKKEAKASRDPKVVKKLESKKKRLGQLEEQLQKLEVQATDKEENKEIALGTSKLNYLDPRISVAWCRKWDVPIEKIYNKTQREKFAWAIDMADEDFVF